MRRSEVGLVFAFCFHWEDYHRFLFVLFPLFLFFCLFFVFLVYVWEEALDLFICFSHSSLFALGTKLCKNQLFLEWWCVFDVFVWWVFVFF